MTNETMIALIPALPLAGFVVNGLWGRRLPLRASAIVGCAGPVLAFLLSLVLFQVSRGSLTPLTKVLWGWMAAGNFSIDVTFRVDALTSVMLLVVTGVGSVIHVYSIEYMKKDPGFARYFAYLNLFMFSMLVLVLADNLVVMFVGWEGVGLCSYLLIGFWFEDLKNADAGRKAFVVNRIGDYGFLLGILFLLAIFGTVSFPEFESRAAEKSAALLAAPALLLFLGACGKSAQIPLHVWLPDAMAGPTPVSALIHAATMVTAGVYMMGRLWLVYKSVPWVCDFIAVVAACTALMAAITACAQTDIKKILAWSTISQLGFMFAGMASLQFQTGIFHVVTHAFFKALLFLGAGAVIHALHGEQDIRKMGGLWRDLKVIFVTFLVGAFALSGFPLTSGFFSKDAILTAVYERYVSTGDMLWPLWILLLGAALLTAFYSGRLIAVVFLAKPPESAEGHERELHRPGWLMLGPLVVLAFLALFGGFLHPGVDRLLQTMNWTSAEEHGHDAAHLLNAGISVVIFLVGFGAALILYGFRRGLVDRILAWEVARGFHQLAANKFYFDEIYRWTVVAWTKTAAAVLWFIVDRLLIDRLLVEGAGWIAYRSATALKRAHTGAVSLAAGAMAAGVVSLLGYLFFRFLIHG
ncbi:MAG TPA: NADH-quinone oxidoreductase subunit L [Planctomycetota bacterium]|nr:NADH-quinone oxidoreductase subunit L [Planctomycetota bacterium]